MTGNDINTALNVSSPALKLDVLFGNLTEMVEFQVEFLKTLEDGTRLVPDLEKLERVDQFKVSQKSTTTKLPNTHSSQHRFGNSNLLSTENPLLAGWLLPLLCRPF